MQNCQNCYFCSGDYGLWSESQPNNYAGEQFCGAMDDGSNPDDKAIFKLSDQSCETESYYLCDIYDTGERGFRGLTL